MTPKPFPNLPTWPEYGQALARRDALAEDLKTALADADRLQAAQADADARDDAERTEAIAAGTKDPGPRHGTKNREATVTARDRARVLNLALQAASEAAETMLIVEPDLAAQAADEAATEAQARYASALKGLTEARDAYFAALRAQSWITDGLRAGQRWKVSSAPPLHVEGIVQANGEPVHASRLFDALRAEAEGAAAPMRGPHVFTAGFDQREATVRPNARRVIKDPMGAPGDHTVVTLPMAHVDNLADQEAKVAASLQRDAEENRAAYEAWRQSPEGQAAQADPLADLREPEASRPR